MLYKYMKQYAVAISLSLLSLHVYASEEENSKGFNFKKRPSLVVIDNINNKKKKLEVESKDEKLIRKIIEKEGESKGYYEIAKLYCWGDLFDDNDNNYKKAEIYFEKSKEEGNSDAEVEIKILYALKRLGSTTQTEDAKIYLSRKATEDNVQAIIGMAIFSSLGKIPDYQKARESLEKAVNMGNAIAMRLLGDLYSEGKIRSDNINNTPIYLKAKEYYIKAIKKGDFRSVENLETLYKEGNLKGSLNYNTIFNLLEKSALTGNVRAKLLFRSCFKNIFTSNKMTNEINKNKTEKFINELKSKFKILEDVSIPLGEIIKSKTIVKIMESIGTIQKIPGFFLTCVVPEEKYQKSIFKKIINYNNILIEYSSTKESDMFDKTKNLKEEILSFYQINSIVLKILDNLLKERSLTEDSLNLDDYLKKDTYFKESLDGIKKLNNNQYHQYLLFLLENPENLDEITNIFLGKNEKKEEISQGFTAKDALTNAVEFVKEMDKFLNSQIEYCKTLDYKFNEWLLLTVQERNNLYLEEAFFI